MTLLTNEAHRIDLLNRLKRAEGQLRGVQRMISDGDSALMWPGKLPQFAERWTAPMYA
jgi:hypothetical protein